MKINAIVKVEKKEEKFWWQKEFQYLLDRKILSGGELAYLFGQIKSIVEQENNLIGNKSVGLDVGKMKKIIDKANEEYLNGSVRSIRTGSKPKYFTASECITNALKVNEDKIIVEVKEK